MAQYQIEILDNTKQRWTIADYANIGSEDSCSINIPTPFIEPRHARLEIRDKQLFIKDLRSKTGTYVNGAQILEGILKDGDMISFGPLDFVIHDTSIKKNSICTN